MQNIALAKTEIYAVRAVIIAHRGEFIKGHYKKAVHKLTGDKINGLVGGSTV